MYNDGVFHLFKIQESDETFPVETLNDTNLDIWYQELSVGDRIKNELHQSGIEVTTKIRIPQYKQIDSKCVVKIGEEFHKVYNAFHFRNSEGFLETDLTLTEYK